MSQPVVASTRSQGFQTRHARTALTIIMLAFSTGGQMILVQTASGWLGSHTGLGHVAGWKQNSGIDPMSTFAAFTRMLTIIRSAMHRDAML